MKLLHARLLELLAYDPDTGVFTWRLQASSRAFVGDVAGTVSNGYVLIGLDGIRYRANRLAWFYVKAVWPSEKVDHKDGDSLNNRFINLRDVTQQVNIQNLRKATARSTSGLLGISPSRGAWAAWIRHEGKTKFLGRFPIPEQAQAAYVAAKRELHEGCTI